MIDKHAGWLCSESGGQSAACALALSEQTLLKPFSRALCITAPSQWMCLLECFTAQQHLEVFHHLQAELLDGAFEKGWYSFTSL